MNLFSSLLLLALTTSSCGLAVHESSLMIDETSEDDDGELRRLKRNKAGGSFRHKIKPKGTPQVVKNANGKIKRRKSVVDLSELLLGEHGGVVDIQLMSDEASETIMMTRDDREEDPFESWFGMNETTGHHLTMIKTETPSGETITTGTMQGKNGTVYQIRTLADGNVVAEEVKPGMFDRELDGPRTDGKGDNDVDPGSIDAIDAMPGGGMRGRRNLRRLEDSPDVLDIMVIYTKGAMCSAAGLGSGGNCIVNAANLAYIEGIITLAVVETNRAYELSGIPTQLRLVKTHYDSTYNDYTNTWETTLGNLRNNGDGNLDYVHSMRDQYGADFVSMIVDTGGYCGIGYMPSSPSAADAFSVVKWNCATGYYSFGHEVGHNMGCNHDIKSAGGSTTQSNYGYQDPQARFRSIMAYDCSPSCARVQYMSNPDATYNGFPIGSATANNAGRIRNNLNAFANFRISVDTVASPTSAAPTRAPTSAPTRVPTSAPTVAPTSTPTRAPTSAPTVAPNLRAVPSLSAAPSLSPTVAEPPTLSPTRSPTAPPTAAPTPAPVQSTSLSLTAPFAGGYSGAAGNMFDIKAKKDMTVTNFAVNAASASMVTVEIYKKTTTGQFLGTQSDSTKWTKIGQATFQTKAQGIPSILPEGSFAPVSVKAGAIQAFYITFTAATNLNRYSIGSSYGTVHVSNGDLEIRHGYAKHYRFGKDVKLRAWNGIIYYRTAASTALRTTRSVPTSAPTKKVADRADKKQTSSQAGGAWQNPLEWILP